MKNFIGALFLFALLVPVALNGQGKRSLSDIPYPYHRNVIKYNPVPRMLWSEKNWTFSYERILNKKQSATIMVGYLEFGKLFDDTIANTVNITDRWKNGINVCFEYRFYLMRRNPRPIPDGLYIAPYLSYYGYKFGNGLDIIQTPADDFAKLSADINIYNLGGELGYQFLLWKRMTIDLILVGPSISFYRAKLHIVGDVEWQDLDSDILEALKEKFPMIEDFVFDKTFEEKGFLNRNSFGLRYVVQIGFHF